MFLVPSRHFFSLVILRQSMFFSHDRTQVRRRMSFYPSAYRFLSARFRAGVAESAPVLNFLLPPEKLRSSKVMCAFFLVGRRFQSHATASHEVIPICPAQMNRGRTLHCGLHV